MAKSTSPLASTYSLASPTAREAKRREARVKRELKRLSRLRHDPVTGAAIRREVRLVSRDR